jgi:hypothetical protein
VPADPSSPIPAALTQLSHTDPRQLQDTEAPHLLAYLACVPDPRGAHGRRHPLVAILAMAAAAVLAGRGRSPRSPSGPPTRPSRCGPRWAPATTPPATSPSRPRPPSAGTLARLDAAALAAAVGAWLADQQRPGPAASRRRAVAVDGKTLRAPAGQVAMAARCTCWQR